MQEVTRYHCGICNEAFNTPEEAKKCESVGVEELRVKVGDYCYLQEAGHNPQAGGLGDRLFGKPYHKPILVKVIGIHGPINQRAQTMDLVTREIVPVPHTYWIWVATKDLESATLPEGEEKWNLPRYEQGCIYIPALRC